jgi:hypothetical protein
LIVDILECLVIISVKLGSNLAEKWSVYRGRLDLLKLIDLSSSCIFFIYSIKDYLKLHFKLRKGVNKPLSLGSSIFTILIVVREVRLKLSKSSFLKVTSSKDNLRFIVRELF